MPQELIDYAGYDSLNTIISDTDVFNMVFKAYCNDDLLNVLHLINTVVKMNPFSSTEWPPAVKRWQNNNTHNNYKHTGS